MSVSNNKKPHTKDKRVVPKRFVTEKIEEIFGTGSVDQSWQAKKIFASFKTLIQPKKRNLFLSLIFFTVILSLGWWYVIRNFVFPEEVVQISVNYQFGFEAYGSIIATPLLIDLDEDGALEVVFADRLGNVFSLNGRGENIYQFAMGKGVVASLMEIEADLKPPREVLVVSEEGDFFVLNWEGNYLYRSRKEFFGEKIFAKPAFLPEENLIFLAGRKGSVWAVHSQYGEVVWVNNYSLPEGSRVFASPSILLQNQGLKFVGSWGQNKQPVADLILVLSEEGRLIALRKDNGFLVWELNLQDRFKASMVIGRFLGEQHGDLLGLASLTGNVYLISRSGQVLKQIDLKHPVISTPAKGRIASEELGVKGRSKRDSLILVNEEGSVYAIQFDSPRIRLGKANIEGKDPSSKIEAAVKRIFIFNQNTFISSPVVVDLNQDKVDDILLLSRSGNIYLVNGKNFGIMNPPFQLDYQVTATPLVGDLSGDGKPELVVAGENGRLEVLGLEYLPDLNFFRKSVEYREFLKGPLNQN